MLRQTRNSKLPGIELENHHRKTFTRDGGIKTNIFFVKEYLIEVNNSKIIQLKHPITKQPTLYVVSGAYADLKLLEVIEYNEPNRSWFINEKILSNGHLYLTTSYDPLFTVLSYMMENDSTKAIPLNHILIDNDYPDLKLLESIDNNQLFMISDQVGDENLRAFRFNTEKTLLWLEMKCRNLMKILQRKILNQSRFGFCSGDKLDTFETEDEALIFAAGLLGEYIPTDLIEKLIANLGLQLTKKRKASNDVRSSGKRTKLEYLDNSHKNMEDKTTVEKKVSAKEKALAKAASGTKSIASFFTKNKSK